MSGVLSVLCGDGGTPSLDTQTVTTGGSGAPPSRQRGFILSTTGSIVDGTSNLYSGATINTLYWDENGGGGADRIVLTIAGNRANSGWTTLAVNGFALNRASATYSNSGGAGPTSWLWTGTGNQFGVVGSIANCVFT